MRFSTLTTGAVVALSVLARVGAVSETMGGALNAFAKRSTVSDILTEIEDAATCAACEVCDSGSVGEVLNSLVC